ncbi:cytochrome P450 [Tothia fuscella]|uniref:Cytochrome P450 n=1 Tax=Tothia fuscella TaxID=1048955 RepID=A0A9P4TTH0_9PEZI|nr:cytochrome P450 [Tothia fuscella]
MLAAIPMHKHIPQPIKTPRIRGGPFPGCETIKRFSDPTTLDLYPITLQILIFLTLIMMAISPSTTLTLANVGLLIGGFVIYQIFKALYRVTFHPLAKFPGPKLAAATYKYEFYYDGIKGGSYIHQIVKMHEEYGPIVRINPNELHCNDPNYIDTIYAGGGAKRDKSSYFVHAFGPSVTGSIFATPKHEIHRRRRAAVNRFFSKATITKVEPKIHDLAQRLCNKLLAQKAKGQPFEVTDPYSQFTTDVVSSYCFGQSHGFLEEERIDLTLRGALHAGCSMLPVSKQWPKIFLLVDNLPERVAKSVSPDVATHIDFTKGIENHVRELKHSHDTEKNSALLDQRSIFRDLLESDLTESEKTVHRLTGEAAGIIGAGTETTAWTLAVLTLHILNNPHILEKLTRELKPIVTDPTHLPSWSDLEKLPYLGAVIIEGVRLSYGVATRLARIAPDETLIYQGTFKGESIEMKIPPGTAIGMTNVLIHANEDIFPRADEFLPERWLKDDGVTRRTDLERYMLSFSRGSRQCIGINLAYCELYITLAALVLRVFPPMKLFESGVEDVEFYRDVFVSMAKPSSKGVRVVIS